MDSNLKEILWSQFGASLDMLENAVRDCPENVWADRTPKDAVWYLTFHTLFWLDYYLTESREDFTPPNPYTMAEMDPAGLYPDRVYTKEELLTYLEHNREKCRQAIANLTEETANRRWDFGSKGGGTFVELIIYNTRHVQHHAAQLNMILRQTIDSAPRWVGQAKDKLGH